MTRIALAFVLALVGCTGGPSDPPAAAGPLSKPLPDRTPRRVTINASFAMGADENKPPLDEFLTEVRRLVSDGGPDAVRRMVGLWPDITLEILRDTAGADGVRPDRATLAAAYDEVFETRFPNAGFSESITKGAGNLEGCAEFRRLRTRLISLLREGQFGEAAKTDVVSALPKDAPPMAVVEAHRLAGTAALLNENAPAALASWKLASAAAEDGPRHLRMELALLVAEANRRTNATDAAVEAWKLAASVGSIVNDPDLWDRAVALRPPQTDWPDIVAKTWSQTARPEDDPVPATGAELQTSDVLMRIGRMRRLRSQPQAALLAFSRAETETPDKTRQSIARYYRAASMIALQQVGSAAAMLDVLTHDADRALARRSQALLGYVVARVLEDRRRGIPILREALADPVEWPGKTAALADFALLQLLDGDDMRGLPMLREAQRRFEREGRVEDLVQALYNESEFHKELGNTEEADKAVTKADALRAQIGLPAPTSLDKLTGFRKTSASTEPK